MSGTLRFRADDSSQSFAFLIDPTELKDLYLEMDPAELEHLYERDVFSDDRLPEFYGL